MKLGDEARQAKGVDNLFVIWLPVAQSCASTRTGPCSAPTMVRVRLRRTSQRRTRRTMYSSTSTADTACAAACSRFLSSFHACLGVYHMDLLTLYSLAICCTIRNKRSFLTATGSIR